MRKLAATILLMAATALSGGEIAVTPPPPLVPYLFDDIVAAASDGRGFYVLFANITTTSGRWLISGSTLDGVVSRLGEGESVGIAASDDGYLVAIVDHGHLRGWRVGTHGELLDTTPLDIGPATAESVTAAWDGTRYVLAWRSGQSVASSFVDRQGGVSGGSRIASFLYPAGIAVNHGVSVLLGYDSTNGSLVVRGSTFGSSDLAPTASSSAIAAGGDGFLATWILGNELFARRLDANGRPTGALLQTTLEQADPPNLCCGAVRVAWDGSGWAIAAKPITSTAIICVRVSADGTMGKPFEAAPVAHPGRPGVAIASNGSRTLIGYWFYGVYTKFLDAAAGVPLHTPWRAVQVGAWTAFDGVDYVVGWFEQGVIRIARVTTRGEPLDGSGIVVASGPPEFGPFPMHLAGGDGASVILWQDSVAGSLALRALRFDTAGTPLDPVPIPIADGCSGLTGATARAVWDGSAFVVFSSCGNALKGVRLGSGVAQSLVYPAPIMNFEVARGGNRFLVVQRDGENVRAFAVSDDLSLATPLKTLASKQEFVLHVSVAFNGSEFLVTWNGPAAQVVAQRVSLNADPIGDRIVVARGEFGNTAPRVRWDGTSWIVTWVHFYGPTIPFLSARVSPSGVVTPPVVVAVAPAVDFPAAEYWSEVGAPRPAIFYSRSGQTGTIDWAPRLYLQFEDAARRRAAGR